MSAQAPEKPAGGLGGQYVTDWDLFFGQEQAKEQLRDAITTAQVLGTRLDHVLLASGQQGVGKSTLAQLIAGAMGVDMVTVSGKITAGEIRKLIWKMQDGQVLFIDEVHQLVGGGKANAEWLLHLLQDGMLVGAWGAEQVPDITIVAATTDAGKLPETILDRFVLRPVLTAYDEDTAADICVVKAIQCFAPTNVPIPDRATCVRIAAAANRNPRRMGNILISLRNKAVACKASNWTEEGGYDLTDVLRLLGLTEDGLTTLAQRYLRALAEHPNGIGKAQLADVLREPGGVGDTERLLAEAGLITFSKSGRVLTSAGIKRVNRLEGGQ
jgi:Holliday junction DNA helicase RuvB